MEHNQDMYVLVDNKGELYTGGFYNRSSMPKIYTKGGAKRVCADKNKRAVFDPNGYLKNKVGKPDRWNQHKIYTEKDYEEAKAKFEEYRRTYVVKQIKVLEVEDKLTKEISDYLKKYNPSLQDDKLELVTHDLLRIINGNQ